MINLNNVFAFDLETVPFFETFDDFLEHDPRGADLFMKRAIRRSSSNEIWNGPIPEVYQRNAALFPEFGKVVTIAFSYFDKTRKLSVKSIENDDEKEFLKWIVKLFNKVDETRWVLAGHNIKGFDIPFLFKKILSYGLNMPICLNTFGKKPWEINILDTMDIWKGTSWDSSSLDEVTYSLGLDSPKDVMFGAEVSNEYWKNKNLKGIETYCKKDTIAVVKILEEMKKSF